jgi:hypothetical protein
LQKGRRKEKEKRETILYTHLGLKSQFAHGQMLPTVQRGWRPDWFQVDSLARRLIGYHLLRESGSSQ